MSFTLLVLGTSTPERNIAQADAAALAATFNNAAPERERTAAAIDRQTRIERRGPVRTTSSPTASSPTGQAARRRPASPSPSAPA